MVRAVRAAAAAKILRRQSIHEIALGIQSEMVGGILSARRLGRTRGGDRLAAELSTFGLEDLVDVDIDTTGDRLYADRSALSASAAFQQKAARGIRQGLTERDAVREALKRTEAQIASSGRYAVSTAWQTERERRAIAAQAGGRVRLAKRWDATLDHRTCPVCGASHGETTFLEDPFSAGTPGAVHPGCRCIEEIRPAWWLGLRDESDRIAGVGPVLDTESGKPPTSAKVISLPPRPAPKPPTSAPPPAAAKPPRRLPRRRQEPRRNAEAAARRQSRRATQKAARMAAEARAVEARALRHASAKNADVLAEMASVRRAADAARRAARTAETEARKAAKAAEAEFARELKRSQSAALKAERARVKEAARAEAKAAAKLERMAWKDARIEISRDTLAAAEQVFGRKLTPDDIKAFLGTDQFENRMRISVRNVYGEIDVAAHGGGVAIQRTVKRVDGALKVNNVFFKLPEAQQDKGLGRRILRGQMAAYKRAGVSEVKLEAQWVGQYAWLRAGYAVSEERFAVLRADFARWLEHNRLPRKIADGVGNGFELAGATGHDGRKLGKEFLTQRQGAPIPMRLDMSPGSPALAINDAYLARP